MKVYDSRPERVAMLARCKRDKIDPASLVEVVAPRGHYAIRCYGLACETTSYGPDASGKIGAIQVPAFRIYSLRRDGKICNGWSIPRLASEMLEISLVSLSS